MHKQIKSVLLLWTFCLIIIPSITFADTSFYIDMDPSTTDVFESDIWVLPGESFSTDVVAVLDGSADTLSSFSFSLWWDDTELNTPGSVSTFPLSGWQDLSCRSISSPNVYNCSQLNMLGYTGGPLTAVVATLEWTALTPLTDGSFDINPYFHAGDIPNGIMPDGAFDKDGLPVSVSFQGGNVSLVPEPISSILFLTGGATLGLRRYWRKNKVRGCTI